MIDVTFSKNNLAKQNNNSNHIQLIKYSQILMYPSFSDPTQTQQFYNDIFDSCFGTEINFLYRYPQLTDYQSIIDSKLLLNQLAHHCFHSNNQQISSLLSELDPEISKRIKKVLKQKINILNKLMLERVLLAKTGNVLIGFNWNVNLVVSHSSRVGCNIPVCALELIVKMKEDGQKRIVVELEKGELSALIEKLKGLEKQVKV